MEVSVMKTDQLIRTIEIKDSRGRVIGAKEVVTYAGLLAKAHDEGLKAVRTNLVQIPTDDNGRTAVAKAEVETGKGFFEAYGDASPLNVNSFIIPHLIRMAETRAKARALRDAVNIGVVSFEELDSEGLATEPAAAGSGAANRTHSPRREGPLRAPASPDHAPSNGSRNAMTEGQRRYLFRLLAGQGLQSDAAHKHLKELFSVESLNDIGKSDAAAMIDRLLNGNEEVPAHGAPQR
jgi:hypothetical protein